VLKYRAVKMHLVLNQASGHEDVWGSGGVSDQIQATVALSPVKQPLVPKSRSGRGGRREKFPACAGNGILVVQPVAWSLY